MPMKRSRSTLKLEVFALVASGLATCLFYPPQKNGALFWIFFVLTLVSIVSLLSYLRISRKTRQKFAEKHMSKETE